MSPYELPPIVRLAERLVVMMEEAVRRFARYHKYTFGTELRQQAHAVLRLCHRAWRDKEAQDFWLDQLMWSVDEFKLSLQLGQHFFFNSSHRATLYGLLKKRLTSASTPSCGIGGLSAGLGGNGGALSKVKHAEGYSPSPLVGEGRGEGCGKPPEHGQGERESSETVLRTVHALLRRTPQGRAIHADQRQQAAIRSVWASYQGHFRHTDSDKLQQGFYRRYDWLAAVTARPPKPPKPPKPPRPLLPCPGLPKQEFHHA